jgi:hypothetical protein
MQKTILPLLAVCLFAFSGSAFQAVMAHRLVTETVEAYAPKIENQAVAVIIQALPKCCLTPLQGLPVESTGCWSFFLFSCI